MSIYMNLKGFGPWISEIMIIYVIYLSDLQNFLPSDDPWDSWFALVLNDRLKRLK